MSPETETYSRVILFAPTFNHTLESMLPVAQRLQNRDFRPVVIIEWREASPGITLLEDADIDYVKVGPAGRPSRDKTTVRKIASKILDARNETGVLWELRQLAVGIRRLAAHIFRCFENIWIAMQLFRKYHPAAVVISSGRTQGLGAFLVRKANRKDVGSILAPQERIRGRDALCSHRVRGGYTIEEAPLYQKIIFPFARRLVSGFVCEWRGKHPLFVPPEEAIVGKLFQVWPEDPWTRGRIPITHYAVQSKAYYEMAEAEGVPASRLELVGYPPYDELFETLQGDSDQLLQKRKAIEDDLCIDSRRRLVLFAGAATNQYIQAGYTDRETYLHDIRTLVQAIRDVDTSVHVLYKAHPRDSVDDYGFLSEYSRVSVTRDADINDLVVACDTFVTSLSSTMFRAIILNKPTITYDFYDNPVFDLFVSRYPGHRSIRNRRNIQEVVRSVFEDIEEQRVLAQEREIFRSEYANFDGRASERMANLIEKVATTSSRERSRERSRNAFDL